MIPFFRHGQRDHIERVGSDCIDYALLIFGRDKHVGQASDLSQVCARRILDEQAVPIALRTQPVPHCGRAKADPGHIPPSCLLGVRGPMRAKEVANAKMKNARHA